ncbi:iron-sulfur cluster-binding domain-containing protein [Companilactobacillus jidongensis]|uniref:iron-sulfur cluster-binding domain-containing protein n=1 Tax=Companilactobacillus jidongensis TaxID=2486006 RepID=UPI000F7AD971|nr:iron-sulfur cluster-binding domain-containing protein [Companilactobacillus jidongensis]
MDTFEKQIAPFNKLLDERTEKINSGSTKPLVKTFPINQLASRLHPEKQFLQIYKIVEHGDDAKSFYFKPNAELGTEHLAYFRAGQYISLRMNIGNSYVTRPYAICSSPSDAMNDTYVLTIKLVKNGFVTPYIWKNWSVGTAVEASAPAGNLYYQPLRDSKHIVAIAGGSGITPFYSMAKSILEGTENTNLTILYGSRTHDNILLGDKLEDITKQTDKVKLVNVLSDEDIAGYEHGFISAEIIKKYQPTNDYSIFICGPDVMYRFANKEISTLNLPAGKVRHELSGNFGTPYNELDYPEYAKDKTFNLTVQVRDTERIIKAKSNESLLVAMEHAGIEAPSMCRSGECGVCRVQLITGNAFTPDSIDGRRIADKKFGYVHTCAAYPLSDLTISVPVHDLADQFG